jgi:hypothetical protein
LTSRISIDKLRGSAGAITSPRPPALTRHYPSIIASINSR